MILKFFTHNYPIKLLIALVFGLIFSQLIQHGKIFEILAYISFGFIALEMLIGLMYVWFINPIHNYINNWKILKIKPNKHYPNLFHLNIFPIFYFLKKKVVIEKVFKFTKHSVFIFENDDILDWSKLFGISFGHHHKNSYRFGFRFQNDKEVEISKYIYENGIRFNEHEAEVKLELNKEYKFKIEFDKKDKRVKFLIADNKTNEILYDKSVKVKYYKNFGYSLGTYIGGNKTFEKTIYIKYK